MSGSVFYCALAAEGLGNEAVLFTAPDRSWGSSACRAAHEKQERPSQMASRKDGCHLEICRILISCVQAGGGGLSVIHELPATLGWVTQHTET